MPPFASCAMGTTATEQYDRRYSPTKPWEFASTFLPVAASNDPPSEFLMRGIGVERGLFGAARVLNALGAGQGVNVFVIKIEVARKRSELRGIGNSRVRIFGTDLRQFERRLQHALDAGGGKIAGVGAGRALSEEDAHADGARARFFQGFDLAQPHHGGKFVAFADDTLGRRRAALHGAADDVGGEGLEVRCLLVAGF